MNGAFRYRLVLIVVMIALVVIAVESRLYQLQVTMSERFTIRALDQHQSRVEVPAVRGAILDRHGDQFAVSLKTASLYAHPQRVKDHHRAADLLAPVIDLPAAEILKLLSTDQPFAYLHRSLSQRQVDAISLLDLPLENNGPFGFEYDYKRFYPKDRLASHVVGFANIDGTGVEGIESVYDNELQGDPAVYLVLQDARNGQVRQLVRAPEAKPLDIVLTIDHVLQHITERELERAMRETGARAVSAVLIDPLTGQILALANRPGADLSHYGKASSAERINRAVVHYYEPGSTFKFIPMAAALELGGIKGTQRIYCEQGSYRIGRRTIHDISKHGMLTPGQILAKSSNIGMVKIVRSLEPAELQSSIKRFGFGSRTGIELPGESPGCLTPVAKWSGLSQDSLAFGQEIGVTVLQMASALATIANDGMQVSPRIVLGTRDLEGRFHRRRQPQAERILSSKTARQITSMLEGVIREGTGSKANVEGYRLAGKSGTAQKAVPGGGYSEYDYIASFGGFGPVDAPRLVLLVVLDSPAGRRHQGGLVAAPVFNRIMTAALRHLRVPGENNPLRINSTPLPRQIATVVPRSEPTGQPGTVPDVRGKNLRDAISTLAAHGFRTKISGSGTVTAQKPAPGKKLAVGATCFVRLQELNDRRVASRPPRTGRRAS